MCTPYEQLHGGRSHSDPAGTGIRQMQRKAASRRKADGPGSRQPHNPSSHLLVHAPRRQEHPTRRELQCAHDLRLVPHHPPRPGGAPARPRPRQPHHLRQERRSWVRSPHPFLPERPPRGQLQPPRGRTRQPTGAGAVRVPPWHVELRLHGDGGLLPLPWLCEVWGVGIAGKGRDRDGLWGRAVGLRVVLAWLLLVLRLESVMGVAGRPCRRR